ncbi:hypothetical protein NDU88_003843 [Pleurodeles waltl]|uniref:Uncharacterized protein n=1 Tax=Pleurodeles waltl TaxID=8319 RepID=A0AAV7UF81_PLEWA|nr:hypothetical protein NDU88_003843 [Pleurodeles waltl]
MTAERGAAEVEEVRRAAALWSALCLRGKQISIRVGLTNGGCQQVTLSPKGRTGSGTSRGAQVLVMAPPALIPSESQQGMGGTEHAFSLGEAIIKPAFLPSDGIPGSPEEKV